MTQYRPTLSINSTISQGSKDTKTVTLIQEWLNLSSLRIGIDGDYGPVTKYAVQKFQETVSLPNTGSVEPETFAKLVEPMGYTLELCRTNCDSQEDSIRDLILKYAYKHAQIPAYEVGGENKGPWVRLYMDGNEGNQWPWCAGFVSFCIGQMANELGIERPILKTYSCTELGNWSQTNDLFVSGKDTALLDKIKPGNVFLVPGKERPWVHTGFISSIDKDKYCCETIEGNTNDKGGREGYMVSSHIRSLKSLDFVIF